MYKMEKVIKLKILEEPPIRVYNHHAFPLGIIFNGNYKFAQDILYNNYIQMIFYNSTNAYGFLYSLWFEDECIFDLNKIEIEISGVTDITDEIIALVKEKISNGWYLLGSFNEYFVPHRKAYKKIEYWHNYLLYGYNDISKCFTIIGYNEKQLYKQTKINYKDYISAVTDGKESVELYFYKVKNNLQYQLDIEKIKNL